MLSVWSGDYDLIILNIGVLLLFCRWVVWVSYNAHYVTVGP